MAKFIKTFEQPDAIITAFANDLGYQEKVANPEFESAPKTASPIMDNPQTREEFVSDNCDEVISNWLSQYAERNAFNQSKQQTKQAVDVQKIALKASIKTVIS